MGLLNELENLGVDTCEGIDRVMGDESLYKIMLDMFVSSVDTSPIFPADFDGPDIKRLTERIHTLKGTVGNLSMTPLFHGYTEILTLLRKEDTAGAKALFEELLPAQERIVDCIRRNH